MIYLLGSGWISSLWFLPSLSLKHFKNSNRQTSQKEPRPQLQSVGVTTGAEFHSSQWVWRTEQLIKLRPGLNQHHSVYQLRHKQDWRKQSCGHVYQLWRSGNTHRNILYIKKCSVILTLYLVVTKCHFFLKKSSKIVLFFLTKWNDKTLVQKLQIQSFFSIRLKVWKNTSDWLWHFKAKSSNKWLSTKSIVFPLVNQIWTYRFNNDSGVMIWS